MTKLVIQHKSVESLKRTKDRDENLMRFLRTDFEDALAARGRQEAVWRNAMRQYEAIPKNAIKNTPIENAPNIEVPFTMMAADIFYSISLQTLFNISPPITVSSIPGRGDFQEHVEAVQNFANYSTRVEMGLHTAASHTLLDNILLGTGVFYTPWVVNRKKTKVHRVISAHPQIQPWPIEDVIVRGGLYQDIQNIPAVHMRAYYTAQEIGTFGLLNKFDTSKAQPTSAVGWVRSNREQLGRTSSGSAAQSQIFETLYSYVYFDYDGDGWDEDLLITWDRTSGTPIDIQYNPNDRRPMEVMRYHPRAYLFYGMGMPEKLAPLQQEITDVHNNRILNMILSNSRMWAVRNTAGVTDNFKVFPGKTIPVASKDDITGIQMGDVNGSLPQGEAAALQLASNLVGLNEMNPAQGSSLFSSRTPATTAQLGNGLQNQRFASTFNSMRNASGNSVKQGLFRYQEKLLAGDRDVEKHIIRVMGKEQGARVIEALKDEHFDESANLELTSTSERTTQEAQINTFNQLNQILAQYYDTTLKLSEIISNPATPTPLREAAGKINKASSEVIERMMRKMDTVRDPQTFIVSLNAEIDEATQIGEADSANQLLGLLEQMRAAEGAAPLDNQLPTG